MNRMLGSLTILLVAALGGCTTVHLGAVSEVDGGDLAVSCGRDPAIRSESYQAVACTFENRGWDGVEVQVRQVVLPGGETADVVTGGELAALVEGQGGSGAGIAPVAAVAVGGQVGGGKGGLGAAVVAGALLVGAVAVDQADREALGNGKTYGVGSKKPAAGGAAPAAGAAPGAAAAGSAEAKPDAAAEADPAAPAQPLFGGRFWVAGHGYVRRGIVLRLAPGAQPPCGLRLVLATPEASVVPVAIATDVRQRGAGATCVGLAD